MSLRDKTEEDIEQDLAPFGFVDSGRDDFYEDEYEKYVPENWMWNTPRDF